VIEVEVGNEIFEFPDGTSKDVMKMAINKRRVSHPPSPPKEEPGFMSNLVSGAKGIADQYHSGVEDTERMVGGLLGVGSSMQARRTETAPPEGFLQNVAHLTGEYLSPVAPLGGLPAGGALAKGALKAKWLGSKAYPPVATAAKKAYGMARKSMGPVKDVASQVGSFLSSIPKESYKRALNNPNILKRNTSDEAFDALGKRAQDAINYVKKEAGKVVEKEANIVRATEGNFNTDDTVKWIKDLLKEHHYGTRYSYAKKKQGTGLFNPADVGNLGKGEIRKDHITTLTSHDRKLMSKVIRQIRGAPSAENILGTKRFIQRNVDFDPNRVKKTSSVGESVLKQISERLGQSLDELSPKLKEANKGYKDVMIAKDAIKRLTTDARIESFFKNIDKRPIHIQDQLAHIDKVAPKRHKFLTKLKDMDASKAFKEIFPGQGGGSGSAEGSANIMRSMALLGRLGGAWLKPTLAPSFSPLAHKVGIKAGVGAGKVGSKLAKNKLAQQAALRQVLKTLSKDEEMKAR
jgi:hypothetical protein